MSDDFDIERMCRLNGKQPTIREKWVAFHRLYRLARGQGGEHDTAAGECFRVLCSDWEWLHLVDATENTLGRGRMPKALRWRLFRHDQRQRMYGDHPEHEQRDKMISREMRERGVEMLPAEVNAGIVAVMRHMREGLTAKGWDLPEDDEELLEWMRAARRLADEQE